MHGLTETPDLFEGTAAAPPRFARIARRSDPRTSQKAAGEYTAGARKFDNQLMLETIAKYPGHTDSEYSVILDGLGVDWYKAARMTSKRISDLRKAGKLIIGPKRISTKTGKQATTYYAKPDFL